MMVVPMWVCQTILSWVSTLSPTLFRCGMIIKPTIRIGHSPFSLSFSSHSLRYDVGPSSWICDPTFLSLPLSLIWNPPLSFPHSPLFYRNIHFNLYFFHLFISISLFFSDAPPPSPSLLMQPPKSYPLVSFLSLTSSLFRWSLLPFGTPFLYPCSLPPLLFIRICLDLTLLFFLFSFWYGCLSLTPYIIIVSRWLCL